MKSTRHCHASVPGPLRTITKPLPVRIGFSRVWLPAFALNLAACGLLCGQVDDFNDGNDDGWQRYDPIAQSGLGSVATYSFPSNSTYRIETSRSPAPGVVGPGRAGALRTQVSYSNFYLSVDIIDWDPTLNQAFGLMARLDDIGLGATDGYAFTYDASNGDLDLTAFLNEDPDDGEIPASGVDNIQLVRGTHYRMIFIGVGQDLTGAIYELPNVDEPIAQIMGVNNQYGSGFVGLINYDNSGNGAGRTDVTYDNFAAFAGPPPRLTFEYAADTRDLAIFWPASATSFVLQASPNLPATVWTNIPPPYEEFGDSKFHFEPTTGKSGLIFRLISE